MHAYIRMYVAINATLFNSAILYLNDNFGGGALFFTNRDAKTVTVSYSF